MPNLFSPLIQPSDQRFREATHQGDALLEASVFTTKIGKKEKASPPSHWRGAHSLRYPIAMSEGISQTRKKATHLSGFFLNLGAGNETLIWRLTR